MSYLFVSCETKGCSVMIGWPVGSLIGDRQCKWCRERRAYYADGSLQKARAQADLGHPVRQS